MKICEHIDDKEKTCGFVANKKSICLWRRTDIIDVAICTKPKDKKEDAND